MNNFKIGFVLVWFLIFATSCSTHKMISDNTRTVCEIDIYYSLGGLGEVARAAFKEEGINRILLINQRRLDGRVPWSFNEKTLSEFVLKMVPNGKDDLLIVLDWEGPVMKSIIRGKSDPRYEEAVSLYLRAFNTVKELRPRAKIGFYGFPVRNYFKRDDSWRERNRNLDELFSQFDALFPSVYDFYDTPIGKDKRDLNYVRDNVIEGIEMGKRIGKPVYPFVWHRYHQSNKKKPLELIPKDEFFQHVSEIALANISGKHVDGLVWWGSEYSQYAKKNLSKVRDKKELRKNWEAEAAEILPAYLGVVLSAVDQRCKE